MGSVRIGLVALLVILLGLGRAAWAGPTLQLPDGARVSDWAGALRLAGLAAGGEDAPLRLEAAEDEWRIVAQAQDGSERSVAVDPPRTDADRESVAFLARGLLRDVLRPQEVLRSRPSRSAVPQRARIPTDRIPTDEGPGSSDDTVAPPTKAMSGRTLRGTSALLVAPDALQRAGTASATPLARPVEAERDLGLGGSGLRRTPDLPPLWLRAGVSASPHLAGTASLVAGTELARLDRVSFVLEVGGGVSPGARELRRFDIEGAAMIAVMRRHLSPSGRDRAVSVGGGLGSSFRTYRGTDGLVARRLVPTASVRLDVPLYSGRRIAISAFVQGRLDLSPRDPAWPGRWSAFEVQPALVIRYHGALGLLSGRAGSHP